MAPFRIKEIPRPKPGLCSNSVVLRHGFCQSKLQKYYSDNVSGPDLPTISR